MNFTFFVSLCLLVLTFGTSTAQTKTWSDDVASIIYNHCTSCHRPGEIAPFPLTNYQEATAWGSMISYVTEIKYMPPWKADSDFGVKYQRENYLTDNQIATIREWVDAGMPQGDPANEPPLPVFPTGSQIGNPDLVLSFSQTHIHPGDGFDEYRYFVLPTGLSEAKNLVALEMRPGNLQIVHHALCWIDSTGNAAANDAQTPEYGYAGGQGGGFAFGTQLPGYVPGQRPNIYSNGIAQRIPPNSDLVVQLHYAPTTSDEPDSSSFNLFFSDQPVTRYVQSKIMLPFAGGITNGPFFIPANQKREFHGVWQVPQDISMLGIAPHMHLLGTHWEVYGVTPTNDTINLIRISDWDFNWQGTFSFKQIIKIPQGTKIHAYAGYDNTVDNPNNPNNPPQSISWGEGTADEMFYLPLIFVPYQIGDENLILDDILNNSGEGFFEFAKTRLYPVAPNPSSGEVVKIGFTIERTAAVSLKVYDVMGLQIAVLKNRQLTNPGEHITYLDTSSLQNGTYYVIMETDGKLMSQKILVLK
jgi:hypothetical protein